MLTIIEGMIVGGTMLVPGVSGGSMAMILGVYDRLVSSVSSFRKHKKDSLLFLMLFSVGGCLGMLLFAQPLLHMIERYPMPMLYFFLGAVAGGVPLIFRQAQIRDLSWRVPFSVLLGLFLVRLFSVLPAGAFRPAVQNGLTGSLLLLPVGLLAAVALVLPGISVSYLFLLLGLYNETVRAVADCSLPFLIPLGTGLLLGIMLTARLLEQAMNKFPQPTYLIILGFVLGSMTEVFPGVPAGPEFLLCMGMLAAGFGVIRLLSRKERNLCFVRHSG